MLRKISFSPQTYLVGLDFPLFFGCERNVQSWRLIRGPQGSSGEHWPVILGNRSQQSTHFSQPLQHRGNTHSRQGRLDLDDQAFASVVIDDKLFFCESFLHCRFFGNGLYIYFRSDDGEQVTLTWQSELWSRVHELLLRFAQAPSH